MRARIIYTIAGIVMAILVALLVWQGSFSFGEFGPSTPEQAFVYWGISTLIFILTVLLGFILVRDSIKLYFQRKVNQEGSRIRAKLVWGALALSLVPAMFLVMFSYELMNLNLRRWFTRPAENIRTVLIGVSNDLDQQTKLRSQATANWIATLDETRGAINGEPDRYRQYFRTLCATYSLDYMAFEPDFGQPVFLCGNRTPTADQLQYLARANVSGAPSGVVMGSANMAAPISKTQDQIELYLKQIDETGAHRDQVRSVYIQLMGVITFFVLFVATWIAFLLARQFSIPISALLTAAAEVRKGNLAYRVNTPAIDELGTLVRGFNEMVQELEANSRELESRRKFTEAILESVPTGVLSVTSDGTIQRANRAARGLFTEDRIQAAGRLEDLFARDDTAEIKYLMKRARRTGVAANQMEMRQPGGQPLHLAVTVAALEERLTSGFVIVLEDTSDLLRAQKAAAWHEVARRIAHELKNPLTPISLCSERITRQLDRGPVTPESSRILRECSITIAREVESVKNLVNEFSEFARFPSAQPSPNDLNESVRNALTVFDGRLEGIELNLDLTPSLPLVNIDPEQIKRVVVNLVDNAAEALQDSLVKRLWIGTRLAEGESVELLVADSGPGISKEDRSKLFLPYFSTKERGTGLGLAIVNHVIHEHHATIRVEDNRPTGARFIVDLPLAVDLPAMLQVADTGSARPAESESSEVPA
jgi:two-component system nitrogen regulation sensor histidine kinase NtrY